MSLEFEHLDNWRDCPKVMQIGNCEICDEIHQEWENYRDENLANYPEMSWRECSLCRIASYTKEVCEDCINDAEPINWREELEFAVAEIGYENVKEIDTETLNEIFENRERPKISFTGHLRTPVIEKV